MTFKHFLYYLTVLLLLVLALQTTAQDQAKVDSLKKVIETADHDTTKVKALNALAKQFQHTKPDTAIYYSKQALSIAEKTGWKKGIANSYRHLGIFNRLIGNYPLAFDYLNKALKIREELKNKKGIASILGSIGGIYNEQGDYSKALEYHFRALKMAKELEDSQLINIWLLNIGIVYYRQRDYPKSLKYYFKSLKMAKELKDEKTIANNYIGIGNIYIEQENYKKALEVYFKALIIYKEIKSKQGVALTYGNIGAVYFKLLDRSKAIEYSLKALNIDKEVGNKNGVARHLNNIGSMYEDQGKYTESENYLLQGLKIAKEIGALDLQDDLHNNLSKLYSVTRQYKKAYEHHIKYSVAKDSLFNEEKSKEIGKLEAGAEYDKQQAVAEAEHKKELEKQEAIAAAESKRQKVIIWAVSGGLLLLVAFAFFIVNRLRITRKQKSVIEEQKQEVEHQKELVDEKNTEIMDSITYAKRIQEAILPPDRLVKEYLKDSFILYKPKDIVAGDFYWMDTSTGSAQGTVPSGAEALEAPEAGQLVEALETNGQTILFAAADCTGHGVPGAMVSVVCHNAMNRAVREFGLRSPAEILDKTNELVEETFEQSESEVKDGMDISLCKLEIPNSKSQNPKLEYAGANNPLYLVRHAELVSASAGELETLKQVQGDGAVLFEFPPDKQPIGKYAERKPFTNHTIELQKGDSIYIFSDGFADQFGGPQGKKFKYRQFRELLLANTDKPMQEQREILNQQIEEWRGELEQVDDICIIGVRV